jgi:hypothetical protein
MCFSASASFSSGAVLLAIGVLSLKSARLPAERPFAAVPLLFALQQLIEGVVWLSFDGAHASLRPPATLAYVFFSHAFWPVFVPFAVLLIEPAGARRRALAALLVLGTAVSAWLFFATVTYGIEAVPAGKHIEYVSAHEFARSTAALYLISTTVSLLVSSHRPVRLFGVLALLSFVFSYAFYATWFISVWCYFAALLSGAVLLHFQVRRPRLGIAAA